MTSSVVSYDTIKLTLKNLSELYDDDTCTIHSHYPAYYSKLATIELCGWIEESIDGIINRQGTRCLNDSENLIFLEKTIIKQTNGFEYEKNIRPMLMKLIGLINLEKIEASLDSNGDLSKLKALLKSLSENRNPMAHTYLKSGQTKILDAPSVTHKIFLEVHSILEKLEAQIAKVH